MCGATELFFGAVSVLEMIVWNKLIRVLGRYHPAIILESQRFSSFLNGSTFPLVPECFVIVSTPFQNIFYELWNVLRTFLPWPYNL